ncbi:MAG: hypothetical protein ACJAUV_002200 [Flavobacteriales bacterium]
MNFDQLLYDFNPISLDEMDEVRLLNRTDTKFVFNNKHLQEILPFLKDAYSSLEINGKRAAQYRTLYFDTEEFQLYKQHHNGKKNRNKVRFRSYVDSNLNFLEVKFKDNKGRTHKSRIMVDAIEEELSDTSKTFLKTTQVGEKKLVAKIWNSFKRITLVNLKAKERLTLDFDLTFEQDGKKYTLDNIIVAEVKQEKASGDSDFIKLMRANHICNSRISKYCTGTALLNTDLKHNLFKEKLLQLKKISNEFSA